MISDWTKIRNKTSGSAKVISLKDLINGGESNMKVSLGLIVNLLNRMKEHANTCLNANTLYLIRKNNDVAVMSDKEIDQEKYIYLSYTTCSFEFIKLAFVDYHFAENHLMIDHTLELSDYPVTYDYYALAHLLLNTLNPDAQLLFPEDPEATINKIYGELKEGKQLIFAGSDDKHKLMSEFYNKLLIYHMLLTYFLFGKEGLVGVYNDLGNLSKSYSALRIKFNVYYEKVSGIQINDSHNLFPKDKEDKIYLLLKLLLVYNPIFRPPIDVIKDIITSFEK